MNRLTRKKEILPAREDLFPFAALTLSWIGYGISPTKRVSAMGRPNVGRMGDERAVPLLPVGFSGSAWPVVGLGYLVVFHL